MKSPLLLLVSWLCLEPTKAMIPSEILSSSIVSSLRNEIRNQVLTSGDLSEKAEDLSSSHRSLAREDWEKFREVFEDAVIKLPDFEASKWVLFSTFRMRAWNMRCYDILLGDMDITYSLQSSQKLSFVVDVLEIDFRCQMDFSWDYGILSGGGNAYVETDNNYASASFIFNSKDFGSFPPSNSRLEACGAKFDVTDLYFSGSLSANLLNIFEGSLSRFIEDAVNEVACDELGALGTTMVEGFLSTSESLLDPYLYGPPSGLLHPLSPEQAMTIPDDIDLLNLRDDESSNAWVTDALKKVDSALGVRLYDRNSPYSDGKDLGINILLRDQILDEDRALSFAVTDLPFDVDPTLFSGHDKLTETTMTLENIKVFGLDTFTHFEPFQRIGNFTLRNDLRWNYLLFELDIKLLIQPSTRSDSIFSHVDPSKMIVENAKIYFGVDDVEAVFSLFMAINEDKFSKLKLGSLFRSENIMPCFWTTLFESEMTELRATAGNVREPELRGFISKGIDSVVTKSVKAAFVMYESAVLEALPIFFQTDLQDFLNNIFFEAYSEECIHPTSTSGSVDFRDLFLNKDDSSALGGSGIELYGDMPPKISNLLKDQVTTVETDGMLSANSMIIDPLTRMQSGVEGKLHFPNELFKIAVEDNSTDGVKGLVDSFVLLISGVELVNIDTLVPPARILEPTVDPFTLDSKINVGPMRQKRLTLGANLTVEVEGEAPLGMQNKIEVLVSSESLEIGAEVTAFMSLVGLFNFPLGDVANWHCWLATLPSPELDESGNRVVPGSTYAGLELKSIVAKITELAVQTRCINCDSAGFELLPEVVEHLQATGLTKTLGDRISLFVEEMIESPTMQTGLDRILHGARASCPHHPEFSGSDSFEMFDTFPSLSEQTIDTIELIGLIATEIALLMFTESQRLKPLREVDYLSGESELNVSAGVRLVDFLDFDVNFSPLADLGLESIRKDLGNKLVDAETGEEQLGINNFMGKIIGDDGVYDILFEKTNLGNKNFLFTINSVRVSGLDSFTQFDVLKALGSQTVQNKISMETLGLDLNITFGSHTAPRDITMSFQLDGLNMTIPFLAAFDTDLITSLELGSLFFSEEVLPCILSTLHEFVLPQMLVTVRQIHTPKFHGLSPETGELVEMFIEHIWTLYNENIHNAVPSLFDNFIRVILNKLSETYVSSNSACENKMTKSISSSRELKTVTSSFIDFRDLLLSNSAAKQYGGSGESPYGDVVSRILGFLQLNMENAGDSLSSVGSNIIAQLTEAFNGEAGSIFFDGDILNPDNKTKLGKSDVTFGFNISNLRLENIDTVGPPFSFLRAVSGEPHLLENEATFGVGDKPLTAGATVLIQFHSEDGELISNEIDVNFDFHAASVILTSMINMVETKVAKFPLGDILNMNCWLATIPSPSLDTFGVRRSGENPTASLTELVATVTKLNLNVECKDCSSPGLQEWAELLSSSQMSSDFTTSVNTYLNYFSNFIGGNFLQIQIDRILNDAAKRCPHSPQYDEAFLTADYRTFETENIAESLPLYVVAACFTAALVTLLVVLGVTLRWIVRRRHAMWLQSLPNQQIFLMKQQQDKELQMESELAAITQPMFNSCDIPLLVRLTIPAIIIINIIFFLIGHFTPGARIDIEATLAGDYLKVENFNEFSMAESILAKWHAGGKGLATFLFVFSGLWPYTKQLITFVLWFVPSHLCSISRRGSILSWLDTLAKWSMFDIFVTIISIAGSSVSIQSPNMQYLPSDFYSIDLLVVPLWGLYANLIAQFISQISSHVVLYYHRNIVYKGMQAHMQNLGVDTSSSGNEWDPYGKRKDQLCAHSYSRPHRGELEKLVVRSYMKPLVSIAALVLCCLVVAGCVLPSLAIEYFGLVGAALKSSQGVDDPVNRYSIFGLTSVLMEQGSLLGTGKDAVGWGGPSTVVILTVLFVPLFQTIALLVQWFFPLTGKARKKLSVVLEILQAWQYAEIYIIAFFVASWQMAPLSEWMFNAYCNELNDMLTNLVYYGFFDTSHSQCFQVQATVQNGAYYLVGGVALLSLLNTYIMKASEQYFRDRHAATEKSRSRLALKQGTPAMATISLEPSTKTVYEGETPADAGIFRTTNGDASVLDAYEVASVAATEDLNMSWEEEDDRYDAEKSIEPIPLLFTDRFRWTLRREVQHKSRRAPQAGKLDNMFLLTEDDKKEPVESKVSDGLPQATLVCVEEASVGNPRSASFRSKRVAANQHSHRSLLGENNSVHASIVSSNRSTMTRSSELDQTGRDIASMARVQSVDRGTLEDGSVMTIESGATTRTADMTFVTGASSVYGNDRVV